MERRRTVSRGLAGRAFGPGLPPFAVKERPAKEDVIAFLCHRTAIKAADDGGIDGQWEREQVLVSKVKDGFSFS